MSGRFPSAEEIRSRIALAAPERARLAAYEWESRINGLLHAHGQPLHRSEGYRPFFIVGAPRSGNTLLRRFLMALPGVSIPPETYVLGSCIKLFRANRHLPWEVLVELTLARFEFHFEFYTMNIPTLQPLALQLKRVEPDRRSLALIVDGFYRAHAQANGVECERWGDKTPANISSIWRIDDTFPDGRYVHIVRDGYDAVYSTLELGNRTLRQSVDIWRESIRTVRRFQRGAPDRVLEIRYEDLVTDAGATVKAVCRFLDLAYDPAVMDSEAAAASMGDVTAHAHHRNVAAPVSSRSIGRGRAALSPADGHFVARRIRGLQRRLGYEPRL